MRTINISQTAVAALRAYKTDIKTMANHFGISTKEMRDLLVSFGFAKPTKSTIDYTINPIFDFEVKKVATDNIVNAVNSFINDDNNAGKVVYSEADNAFVQQD